MLKVYDGCDEAILGYSDTPMGTVVVYGYDELIEVFKKQGMDTDGAREWIAFNIEGVYLGEHTPIVLNSCDRDHLDYLADAMQEEADAEET